MFWGHFCSWHRQPLRVYHNDSFSGFTTTSTSRSNVLVCNHRNRSTGFSHKMHILTVYTRFLLNHIKHFSHPLTSGLIVFLCATTAGWSTQAGARQCAAIFPSVLASRDVWPFNVTHTAQHLPSHDALSCRLLRFILQLRLDHVNRLYRADGTFAVACPLGMDMFSFRVGMGGY